MIDLISASRAYEANLNCCQNLPSNGPASSRDRSIIYIVNEISSLPSLSDLLTQNSNLQANKQLDRFAKTSELGQGFGAKEAQQTNGVDFVPIDKTSPTDRVTAPGFSQMFENFVKGVDQKKKDFSP